MDKFVGHQKQWGFLKNALLEKRLSHAYLFSGPEGIGKKTFVLELVNFQKNHADFFLVEREPDKKDIQISQIRNLVYQLSLKPFVADYKIAVIDQAHLMNQHSQNCLLKTLEEPKGNTILFLITEHSEVLFETILSRVQQVKFQPVSNKKIEQFLLKKGASEKQAKEITFWCLGAPGKALEFLQNPDMLLKQKKQAQELAKILKSDLAYQFQYAKTLSEKSLKQVFEAWLKHLRQSLIEKINSSVPSRISFFQSLSLQEIKKIINEIEKINFLISTKNINKRLALEILMLKLQVVSAKL